MGGTPDAANRGARAGDREADADGGPDRLGGPDARDDSDDSDDFDGPDAPDVRTALWYALLFSVPVGVGVAAGTMRMSGEGFLAPVVALPGLFTAVCLFAFVFLAARVGGADR